MGDVVERREADGEKRGPRDLQLARRVEQGSVRVSGGVYV